MHVKISHSEQIMTANISVLLIEDEISVTAQIASSLSQQLNSHCLSIVRDVAEARHEQPPADAILLSLAKLDADPAPQLAALSGQYPGVAIYLLVAPSLAGDDRILAAMLAGAADFVVVSPAGLLSLGRRLAQITPPPVNNLGQIFGADSMPMAIQIFDEADRAKVWNPAAEKIFGLTAAQALNQRIDELPLDSVDVSRLKDMIDQARATRQPFFVKQFSLENQPTSWLLQAYVYPLQSSGPLSDICIVTVKHPKIADASTEALHFNQELQLLLEASREMGAQLALKPTLEKVSEQVLHLLYGNNCQIYFLEKDNQTLRPVLAIGPLADQIGQTTLSIETEAINRIITRSKTAILSGAAAPFGIAYSPGEQILAAPLTAARGTIGLMVVSRHKQRFDPDDLRFFETLVHQASAVINNARLFEETQRNLIELEILYSASTAISSQWDHQDVLNTLIRQIVNAINVSMGFVASWEKSANKGLIRAIHQSGGDNKLPETAIDLSRRTTLQKMLAQPRPMFLHLSTPFLDNAEKELMEQCGAKSRLLLPLVAKGEAIGWVELWQTKTERIFSADEVRLSRALATQIAIALQNANYFRQTQQTLDETSALYRVANALTTLQEPQAIMSTVLQEYLQALHLTQGSVILFDFAARQGVVRVRMQDNHIAAIKNGHYTVLEGQQIPLSGNPVYEKLMRTRRSVIITNPGEPWLTRSSIRNGQPMPPAGGWGNVQSFAILVVPIIIREEIVGAMVVENTQNDQPFNDWIVSLGQAMADQLAIGLQSVQLFEAEYRRREQAETLREVSSIVSSSLNLNEVLERVLDQLGRVVKYNSAGIHLIEGKTRRVIAGRGFPQGEKHIGLTFPIKLDETEPGSIVIHTRQPAVHSNISDLYPTFKGELHRHIKSWMGVPLIARDKVIGLISIDHSESHAYNEEDVQMALAFANQVAIALENARLYELEVRELERELKIAHQIQETLLPQTTPKIPGLDIAGRIIPARQVGGDFFHYFSTGPDQLGLAIGDVSGKGIPAALYMAAGITAIDTQIGPDVQPGELLNRLNKKLYNRLHENKMNIALQIATFMPFSQADYPLEQPFTANATVMTIASAGMIAPIGATRHGCRLLPVGALPVGAMPAPPQFYTDDVFFIEPSTAVIFTSDGIVEAQNEFSELFGFERLEQAIMEIVDTGNAERIADHIINSVNHFTGDVEKHDDMTVVVVTKR